MSKKKQPIRLQLPLVFEFGSHRFYAAGDELVYQNTRVGKPVKDRDKKFTGESAVNAAFMFWNKKTNEVGIHVPTTLKKLEKLVTVAKRDNKKFKKWDRKRRNTRTVFFKHFGNVSFCFVELI